MVKLNLDIIDNKVERYYDLDMDRKELVERFKTRNEDEDLVLEFENETIVIPVYILDKSIVYICDSYDFKNLFNSRNINKLSKQTE